MVPYPKLENMTNWWHEMATLQILFIIMAKKKSLTTTVLPEGQKNNILEVTFLFLPMKDFDPSHTTN